jgi:hypothetical protein
MSPTIDLFEELRFISGETFSIVHYDKILEEKPHQYAQRNARVIEKKEQRKSKIIPKPLSKCILSRFFGCLFDYFSSNLKRTFL